MATRLFTVDLDLGLNKARRFIFEDFNTTPSNGSNAGRVIYWTAADADVNHLKVYNGTSWKTLAYTDDIPPVSISLEAPTSVFGVSGSPADANGTLSLSFIDQSVNTVFAGPATGGSDLPTFRSLVDADIPVEIARVDDVNNSLENYILLTEKGEPLGVAELDASGYVPSSQISPNYVTLSGTQTLTNKTFEGSTYFDDPQAIGNAYVAYDAADVLSITSSGAVEVNAQQAAIILSGSTGEYLNSATTSNQIAVIGDIEEYAQDAAATAIVTNGTHAGIAVLYNDAQNAIDFYNTGIVTIEGTDNEVTVLTTGTTGALNAVIGLPDNVTIAQNLKVGGSVVLESDVSNNPIAYLSAYTSGSDAYAFLVATDVGVTANGGNASVNSSAGNVILNGFGGEYLGSATTSNQIATIGDLASSTVQAINNVDGNLDISTSGSTTTIDLATNIEIAGTLDLGSPTLSTTSTGSAYVFNDNAGWVYIGGDAGIVEIGSTSSTTYVNKDLVVQGDLTVNGSTTTLNTETLAVEDNVVVLNSNVTGTPTANAGIEVERGTDTNASLLWDETANIWKVGIAGSEFAVARKYVTSTTGTTHTITHNLGTSDVTVNCWVSGEQVEANVVVTDANTVTVTTNSSLTVKTVVIG